MLLLKNLLFYILFGICFNLFIKPIESNLIYLYLYIFISTIWGIFILILFLKFILSSFMKILKMLDENKKSRNG